MSKVTPANARSGNVTFQDAIVSAFDQNTDCIDVGSSATPTHTAYNVTNASTTALAANATRRFILLVNDSDTDIYVNLAGATAVLNQGVRLSANGGSLLLDTYCPVTAIKAIHGSSGNKALLFTEG